MTLAGGGSIRDLERGQQGEFFVDRFAEMLKADSGRVEIKRGLLAMDIRTKGREG